MLSAVGTMESSMSKAGLDDRHRNNDGEISHKHGNTLIGTLRKVYGQSFAAGYPEAEKLSEVLLQLNQTSVSQLRRDNETGHLEHKIANASKQGRDLNGKDPTFDRRTAGTGFGGNPEATRLFK